MYDLESHRKHYAQLVTAIGGVDETNKALALAFSTVRREDYLGPGPWKVRAGKSYVVTPTDDPAFVYQNVLIAIKSEEGLNNGQPSLHAGCLNALGIATGNTIIHIGTGTGYYTEVQSLRRDSSPDDTCWFNRSDCWLSTKSVENSTCANKIS